MHMQPDEQQTQFWGQVDQQPTSTQINPSTNPVQIQQQVQPGSIVQPIQQQGVVYIKVPKFKHQTRTLSYILIGSGLLVYFISLGLGISTESELALALGGGTCCLAFNAAFVCEIIFYSKMLGHNKTYGESDGWAITNIVLGSILLLVGLIYIIGIAITIPGL
jgi:hypothetical protein